jgi:hypothetical protein
LFSFWKRRIYYCLTRLTAQIIKNIAFFSKAHQATTDATRKFYCNEILLPLKTKNSTVYIQFTSINDEGRK